MGRNTAVTVLFVFIPQIVCLHIVNHLLNPETEHVPNPQVPCSHWCFHLLHWEQDVEKYRKGQTVSVW